MVNAKSSGFRKKAASLLAAAALALFPSPSRSYEPGTVGNPSTHPLLSRESVKLYMNSPHYEEDPNGRRINIRDLEKGTIEEDSPPYRSVHHFMEWNTGRGLDPVISAKEWALNEEAQTEFWGGNYSWPRAVREQDTESLGHILHLIQDLSVPAHSRDDAHPGFFSKLEDADSELERELILALNPNHEDSYELWAHENKGKISQLTPETVPYYNRLEDIFDYMANVSGSLFLSDDTTFETGKYRSPRGGDVTARRIAGRQYYMANIARKEVPLARKGFLREYVLDHYVLNEQWKILGTKAVEMGAAAIQLYFESIGGENPDQPECIPRERLECIDGDVYRMDGCGRQERYQNCSNTQSCRDGRCIDDVVEECRNGEREEARCGLNNNGTMERACSNGNWGRYSSCADPDTCRIGDTQESYSGPPGTAGVGLCEAGLNECRYQNGVAVYVTRRQEVTPANEVCGNRLDEDCDGGDEECPRFETLGNGTMMDHQAGRVWQLDYESGLTWVEAADYCNNLVLGGSNNWRLPTFEEYLTVAAYCNVDERAWRLYSCWTSEECHNGGCPGEQRSFTQVDNCLMPVRHCSCAEVRNHAAAARCVH